MKIAYNIFHDKDSTNHFRKSLYQSSIDYLDNNFPALSSPTIHFKDEKDTIDFIVSHDDFNPIDRFKKGEIGIWASNYLSWKNFLDSDFDALINFEDDGFIQSDFKKKLDILATELPDEWDILGIYYSDAQASRYKPELSVTDNLSVCFQTWSNLCYMISRSGAKKVLEYVNSGFSVPIDLYLFGSNNNLNVYNSKPDFGKIIALAQIPSTIQQDSNKIDLREEFYTNKSIWQKLNNKSYGKIQLSVIIPTYKNTQFLKECFSSIVGILDNIEVLVGIDGCELTLEFIKKNKFPDYFRFFYFEKNVGPYVIKNSLSEIASSENLLFFDSDDILCSETISSVVKKLNIFDCVRLRYHNFTNDDSVIQINSSEEFIAVIAIKKSVFLSMNGFEPWRCEADTDFLKRLTLSSFKVIISNEVNYNRRIHKDSLTNHESTGYYSALRESYRRLTKSKEKNILDKLVTEKFNDIGVKITALLLNWKRQENILKVIESIKNQNTKIDIWLWNNNSEDNTKYDVDVQINSSANFKCWPRWLLGSMAEDGYIFTIDDDIMFSKNDIIRNCLNTLRTIDSSLNPIIGYTGVQLNSNKDYWSSKHIHSPKKDEDVVVDIIKGRFMFMHTNILKDVKLENEADCEDIKISSYSKHKIIPSIIFDGLQDLKSGDESLHKTNGQNQKRTIAVNNYF